MKEESTFDKISRKTGRKPVSCKCQLCKKQCQGTPCLGTPEDMGKLIKAGYADRLAVTDWAAGVTMRLTDEVVVIIAPIYDEEKGACTFFTNGLCELHDKGLKPTEGKLSHHSQFLTNPKKSIGWAVAKEWQGYDENDVVILLHMAQAGNYVTIEQK